MLDPAYDDTGKPKHPYSGKLYTLVHPLADYDESAGPTHHVSLQNAHRLNLPKTIIAERESEFPGKIEEGRVAAQMAAKFPNFARGWMGVDSDKYGLTEELFNAFQEAFTATVPGSRERQFVEALLSHYLSRHSELKAIEAATEAARQQGSWLVYRTGQRTFGFTAPLIERGGKTPIRNPAPDLARLSISDALKLLVSRGIAFTEEDDAREGGVDARARALVQRRYGPITQIDGSDLACYVRSIVTAAAQLGFVTHGGIEAIVDAVLGRLDNVHLRTRRQMVDAGGLVAAEVRRVVQQLTAGPGHQGFDPQVTIVMSDHQQQDLVEFQANDGVHPILLFFSNAHFEVVQRA